MAENMSCLWSRKLITYQIKEEKYHHFVIHHFLDCRNRENHKHVPGNNIMENTIIIKKWIKNICGMSKTIKLIDIFVHLTYTWLKTISFKRLLYLNSMPRQTNWNRGILFCTWKNSSFNHSFNKRPINGHEQN